MTDFEQLVFDMRQAQKTYFRTRTPVALNESKRLERAVDQYLENIKPEDLTPDLFSNPIRPIQPIRPIRPIRYPGDKP